MSVHLKRCMFNQTHAFLKAQRINNSQENVHKHGHACTLYESNAPGHIYDKLTPAGYIRQAQVA
jgi:hypothetical protein